MNYAVLIPKEKEQHGSRLTKQVTKTKAEGPQLSLLRTVTSGFLAPKRKGKPLLIQFTSQRKCLITLLLP